MSKAVGDRGLRDYVEFDDTHGTEVRVRSSSQAMYDAVWLFLMPRDPDWHQRTALHLNVEQARALVAGLSEWLAEHA